MRDLWVMWNGEVSDTEIEWVTQRASVVPAQVAMVSLDPALREEVRRSQVRFLTQDTLLRDWLWRFVDAANRRCFQVDVRNEAELQYTEYYATNQGHYDWHYDVFWDRDAPTDRKLSVVVTLNEGYEGGAFEFCEVVSPPLRAKGSVLVFPSYLKHRVLPVTGGERRSLVAWFSGPRWR